MNSEKDSNLGIKLWNEIHGQSTWVSDFDFPSPNAQAFVQYHLPQVNGGESKVQLLDLGCGTGAATVFFAQMGYKVCGLDASSIALDKAKARANQEGVRIQFELSDFRKLPFPDNNFDAVYSESVLYYGAKCDFEAGVQEVYRVLKPSGVARIYTKTIRDVWAQEGEPLGENTFRVASETWERGLMIYCATLDEIKQSFAKFTDLLVGIKEFNYIELNRLHSFWVITCRKP